MRQARCKQCGAPINLSADLPDEKRVCAYCGAPISLEDLRGARPPGQGRMVVLVAVAAFVLVVVGALVFLLSADDDERATSVARPAAPPPPAPPPAPLFAPEQVPPFEPEPPEELPPPPREPTVNDQIRAHFKEAGGRLCVAGNLARFGPFMGKVRLTSHPDGRVSGLRGEMQPSSPGVIRCMRQKLASGPVFSGGTRTVIYHFSGGRSPDGLQYRDGIEFKVSKQDAEAPEEPAGAAAAERGPQEKEGTVLKVEKLRGGQTIITSRGIQRIKGPPTYEVQVGLGDGTRISFIGLKNRLEQGSKVLVRYVADSGGKTMLELPVGDPGRRGRVKGEVLPTLKPTPIGDKTYTITFPAPPEEQQTDLGTLYRYGYKFSKRYPPDTFFFFRTSAEGNGNRKFFKEQTASLLALAGGTEVAVRLKGPGRDRRTGLKKATGRFTLRLDTYRDGLIHLWYDARKKILYGAWVLAYSSNQLASDKEMKRDFFGSFALK